MAYSAITDAEVAADKFAKQSLFQKIKDNIEYIWGLVGTTAIAETVTNGSLEIDSDADGTPDTFTAGVYSGGTKAIETTNVAQGSKAFKFVHPGGAGNGGGWIMTDYIAVGLCIERVLCLSYYCTAAGMKCKVEATWYDTDLTSLGTHTLYSSTSNPTSYCLLVIYNMMLYSSAAKYVKFKFIGGYTDTDVSGTVYVDDFRLESRPPVQARIAIAETINQSEVSASGAGWADVGSTVSLAIPAWASQLIIPIETKSSGTPPDTPQVRLRVGAVYGNASEGQTETADTYKPDEVSVDVKTVAGTTQTFSFQAQQATSTQATYVKSPSTLFKAYTCRRRMVNYASGVVEDDYILPKAASIEEIVTFIEAHN